MMPSSPFDRLKKLEFVVTLACTGACAHCSQGDHKRSGTHLDPKLCAKTVHRLSERYTLETVLAFGGEPLLFPQAVLAAMSAARQCAIPHRQVITNGAFTRNLARMREVVEVILQSGVSDLRLSVDAFHEATLDYSMVRAFAREAASVGLPISAQPAWLVSSDHDNPYNRRTRFLLKEMSDLGISSSSGNVVFPEGKAKENFAEYFIESSPENPYVEDPRRLTCLSVDCDGSVLGGNLYRDDLLDIMANYEKTIART